MKKILLTILAGVGVLLTVILIGTYFQKQAANRTIQSTKEAREGKNPITIGKNTLYTEIADNPEARAKGLSGRSEMAGDEGMLFKFEQKDVQPQFWMKGMVIPLDFLWINDDKIVQINENVQPPTTDANITTIVPNSPIDYVIEVNAGYSVKNSLKIGDTVTISL
jgi:hypothetical protein